MLAPKSAGLEPDLPAHEPGVAGFVEEPQRGQFQDDFLVNPGLGSEIERKSTVDQLEAVMSLPWL
jgi:hypothetical protein